MTAQTCPQCDGRGTNAGLIHYVDGFGHRASRYDDAIRCSLCGGTGQISKQTAEWLAIGRQHYETRIARDESLRECAVRMGIKASELSAMEHGRADPAKLKEQL